MASVPNLNARIRLALWRQHLPCFTDILVHSPNSFLKWSSPTVDWINDPLLTDQMELPEGSINRVLVLGTESDGDDSFILLCRVTLPSSELGASYPPSMDYMTIPHQGDVEKARSMPQSGRFLATKSCSITPGIYIYDVACQLVSPTSEQSVAEADVEEQEENESGPILRNGSNFGPDNPAPDEPGMSWSPSHRGLLASTCIQGTVALYDIEQPGSTGSGVASSLSPCRLLRSHSGGKINDVAFAGPWSPDILASVGEDGTIAVWDIRAHSTSGTAISGISSGTESSCSGPVLHWCAHSVHSLPRAANGVSFPVAPETSGLWQHVVATCGSDGRVKLWDMRQGRGGEQEGTSIQGGIKARGNSQGPTTPLKDLKDHHCKVNQVSWSPSHPSLLASTDARGLVYLWDLQAEAQIGGSESHSQLDPIPKRPELRMIHAGHGSEVRDLSWSPPDLGSSLISTVSSALYLSNDQDGVEEMVQDHNVQIWKPSRHLLMSDM